MPENIHMKFCSNWYWKAISYANPPGTQELKGLHNWLAKPHFVLSVLLANLYPSVSSTKLATRLFT